jgi:hypothetical protein
MMTSDSIESCDSLMTWNTIPNWRLTDYQTEPLKSHVSKNPAVSDNTSVNSITNKRD